MGHFHNPPPGPIAGATAAQPYGRPKLPPAITAVPVNNPPFADPSRTPAIIAENAAIAQPDPWGYVFEAGNGYQPYAGSKLPPAITAVPVNNPPFSHPGRMAVMAEIARLAQPDPWVYSIQPGTGFQPYGRGKLTPPSVDNPPQLRYRFDWMADVISRSWQPPDPLPTLIGKLSPGIPGQSVDNPPQFRLWQSLYPPDAPPLQPQVRYVPQVAVVVAAQNPYFNAWLSAVLQSWVPGDPLPTLPRNLNPFFTAVQVDNPPFSSRTQIPGIVLSWLPPDPLPTLQGKLSPGIPGQSVDNPPGLLARQIPYPPDAFVLPQQLVLIPQAAAAGAVQNPFVLSWLSGVLQSWQPGDPPVQLPRNLSPFFLGVQVDNPPFSYGGRNVWASDLASRAWQPPDPQPTLSGKLSPTIIAVRVDNPPFSSRSELANILGQWQFPPPQPTPSFPPLQPQGGTTPPPPVFVAQFTVSGSDVSVHFAEFFTDVVFTDAPITKRTN